MAIDKESLIDAGLKCFLMFTSIGMALCMTKCIGNEIDYYVKTEICNEFLTKNLSAYDRKTYERKMADNKMEADFYFKRAKEAVPWIPKMTCREAMQVAWSSALSQCAGGTPQSKLCAVIIVLVGNIGMGCYDKYREITEDLQKAQYHYELYEWYDHVLRNG